MDAKKATTFRLSAETTKELESIAKKHGVSKAQVVSLLSHAYCTGTNFDEIDTWFDIARRG